MDNDNSSDVRDSMLDVSAKSAETEGPTHARDILSELGQALTKRVKELVTPETALVKKPVSEMTVAEIDRQSALVCLKANKVAYVGWGMFAFIMFVGAIKALFFRRY